jgi:xanthine dehydrogenase accessory factor
MLLRDFLVLLRGGGDLATGVAARLHRAGFPLIVLELPEPLVVRRSVALASAVNDGEVVVEDLRARRASNPTEAARLAAEGIIPVLVAPQLEPVLSDLPRPVQVVVDARVAKRNIDTRREQAPLVVALGPGFTAGVDCDAVVETMRGHTLGRVIWDGAALPNTGTPGIIGGHGAERVLRAPAAGMITWQQPIGALVGAGELLGHVAGEPVHAPFAGVVRGQIAPGTHVTPGMKIGDVDARGNVDTCFQISDKSLAIGGGVLEAILVWLNRHSS